MSLRRHRAFAGLRPGSRAADGTTSELARWSAVTDQDVVLAAATDLARPRLAELEVRNAAGTVVLRAEQ